MLGIATLAGPTAGFIAARQSGGALGVAVLGALFAAGPHAPLRAPMSVAATGYAGAVGLAWFATGRPRQNSS